MLVEHVLRANNPGTGRLTFTDKLGAIAKRPSALPVPLDAHTELWDRLAALYKMLLDARHAVTHRRFQVTQAGDLQIFDEGRRPIDTIVCSDSEHFGAAVHAVAELAINTRDDRRQANIVTFHLNALQSRHHLSPLVATDPNAPHALLEIDLIDLGDGRFRFEVAPVRDSSSTSRSPRCGTFGSTPTTECSLALWEDLVDKPAAALDFHPAAPPTGLSEELPPI